jgi:rRNA-processing protein FCF1
LPFSAKWKIKKNLEVVFIMEKILLDTNFILVCIRNKIDFLEELELSGRRILLPIQVIDELKNIAKKGKPKLKQEAEFALMLLENAPFEKIDLKEKYVDKGIRNFILKNKSVIVATLDKELKRRKNYNMVITRKKKIEIV